MDITLAFVTDLHFGPEARFAGKLRKLTGQAGALASAFVARMNRDVRPDLVVNLGDDIEDESPEADRARYAECQAILRGADAELVNVAGNHDTIHLSPADLLGLWGGGPASILPADLTPQPPSPSFVGRGGLGDASLLPPLPRHEGEGGRGGEVCGDDPALYRSMDRGGLHFVILHTRERKDHDVSIGDAQLAWLADDLRRHPGPTLVLMHHSAADQDLRGNRWFEGAPHICLVRERRKIRALFEEHGDVRAVFNGHLHWNHLDVVAGIPYVTLQSLIENVDDDAPGRPAAAHAVVRVSKNRIVVDVEGAARAKYQFDRRD